MKIPSMILIFVLTATRICAESSALSSFGDTNDLALQGKRDFRVGSSFSCYSDRLATIGFMVPYDDESHENMGELKSYKDVAFGFSIIGPFDLKFSNSYPLALFGDIFEASGGIDKLGEAEYTLGFSEGKIRRETPEKYHLRVIDWFISQTTIMHATCEKL